MTETDLMGLDAEDFDILRDTVIDFMEKWWRRHPTYSADEMLQTFLAEIREYDFNKQVIAVYLLGCHNTLSNIMGRCTNKTVYRNGVAGFEDAFSRFHSW